MVTNVSSSRASLTRGHIVASRHFQLTCTNYAFSLASVVLLLRAHLPTLAHDATNVRLGRARPNARGIYAHTSFPGAPDVRRQPQPTDSAAGGARVLQVLGRPYVVGMTSGIDNMFERSRDWVLPLQSLNQFGQFS